MKVCLSLQAAVLIPYIAYSSLHLNVFPKHSS
jgi:hypothetical protein